MAQRNQKGQFKKGSSGNTSGRPTREKPSHRLPAKNRKAILDIAEREIEVTISGEKQKMTLFEAAVLRLATASAQGDRVASRMFAEMVMDAAKEDLTMSLRTKLMMQQMDEVWAENETLRGKVAARNGVVHDRNYDWSWTGVSDDARLDDGRTTMEG